MLSSERTESLRVPPTDRRAHSLCRVPVVYDEQFGARRSPLGLDQLSRLTEKAWWEQQGRDVSTCNYLLRGARGEELTDTGPQPSELVLLA
jgi:hypothetical protein